MVMFLSIGQMWATDYETVATFESSVVVTSSGYNTYSNDDWTLSKGGNNSSCGFNKSNKTEIGNAYGTDATTTHHGYTIVSKDDLSNVCKITFVYTGVANGNKGTPRLYLGYSTDDGDTWSPITLATGAGLSAQGVQTAVNTTYTFQFTAISSARYAIVHSASRQLTGNNDTFRFDNVTATFYAEESTGGDVIVKTLKSIAVTGQTTAYEVGDVFSFDGTCTATYSVTKNDEPQSDENKVVTPTEVTSPDMSSAGNKTITVSYTEDDVTKTTTYNITVAAALPKITIDGTATGITSTDEDQSITVGAGAFGGTFKQYGTTALWFTKGSGFIYNKESFGKIRKITINYKSGGSTDAVQWLRLGDEELNSFSSETTNGVEFTTSSPTSPNTFVVTGDFEYFCLSVSSSKNLQATSIVISYEADPTAPSVTIDPTEVDATAEAANGLIDVTYTNIASATVGLFNDAECNEAFTGDWLEATLNGDKDIVYTIAANTGDSRTAYIKLTAQASNGTSPDVVKIIEVSQAKGIPTYTALDAIFDAATGTDETVKVTFNNWVISALRGTANAYLTDGTYGLIIYTEDHGFNVGDVLSGTVQTTLTKYQGNAELKGLMATSDGLTVTPGDIISARVLNAEGAAALTGANAGSLIKISGECTETSSKYYIQGIQLFNSLFSYETPTVGDVYDCTGIFVMYNTTKEILPRQDGDLVASAVTPTAVITFEDFNIEKGQNTTLAATVAPAVAASAEVTYSIVDGGEYVSLAGDVLTATEVGTAHIRATVADGTGYNGNTKDITVTVTAPDSRKTAVINGITAVSGTLVTETAGSHKDKEYISYAALKGNAANAPVIPSGKSFVRIYQNGGYLAINAVKGCLIDEVIVSIPSDCNPTTIAVGTDEENLPTTGGSSVTAGNNFSTGTGLNSPNVYLVCLGTDKNHRLEVGAITVKYNGDPISVKSIALSGEYQTEFTKNATFNHDGVIVTATYTDDSQADVTTLAEFSEPDMSTLGQKEITVSYGGKSTSYNIEVVAATLTEIAISGTYPTRFNVGDEFSHAGMTVTATYSDFSEEDVTDDATFSGYDMLVGGIQTVTVEYGDQSAQYSIIVVPANTDVITAADLAATSTQYKEFSGVTDLGTSAVYAGKTAKSAAGAIQVRTSQSEDGIVVTGQNGTKVVKSVAIDFATVPTSPKVLQVYGKHTAYSTAEDLFNEEKKGDLIGTLGEDGSVDCTAANYEFIGIRSSDGAMYLASVMVTWGDAVIPPTVYTVTFNTDGGSTIDPVDVEEGQAVAKPADPTKDDYNFVEWQLNGVAYDFTAAVTASITLDAVWESVTPPTPTYTEVRNGLNAGEYYTMCLDKAVTAVQGGTIWRVLSKAENGTDVILEEVEGTLDAGRPYIFFATATSLEVAYTGAAVGAPIPTGNNGLIGSFTKKLIEQAATNYIIYNNALYFVNSANVYVGEHRAYLDMTDVPAYGNEPQQGNAPRRRVTMAVHGPQVATGIDALNTSDAPAKVLINGQLFIIRGEKMFDAKGQLVK